MEGAFCAVGNCQILVEGMHMIKVKNGIYLIAFMWQCSQLLSRLSA